MQRSESFQPTPTIQAGLKDLTGQTFGNLRVIRRAENYKGNKSAEACWTVQCVRCGFLYPKAIRGSFLRGGRATGKKCKGCRGDQRDAPPLIIDKSFIEKWTPLLSASIGKVLGFGRTFAENKDDLLQDIWLQLSKFRGDVPEVAMSTFMWQVGKTNAINLLKKRESAKHHPTIAADDETYHFILDNLTDRAERPELRTPEAEAFAELSDDDREFCRKFFADTRFKTSADKERATAIREHLKQRVLEMTSPEVYAD